MRSWLQWICVRSKMVAFFDNRIPNSKHLKETWPKKKKSRELPQDATELPKGPNEIQQQNPKKSANKAEKYHKNPQKTGKLARTPKKLPKDPTNPQSITKKYLKIPQQSQ